jgi:hypothetical protein
MTAFVMLVFVLGSKICVPLHKISLKTSNIMVAKLDKAVGDKVSFITFIIPEFAAKFRINVQEAYRYLKQYGGLDFLHKHWWALHTDNEYYTLLELYDVCRENGGYLK